MSSGSTTKNVSNALKPYGVSSPFGTLSVNSKKHSASYSPNFMPGQQQVLNTAAVNQANLIGQMGQQFEGQNSPYSQVVGNYVNQATSLTPDSLYNNPFYQNEYNLLMAPVTRQYQQDQATLDNNLNAQNQLGGSYAAYAKNLLDQNYQYNQNQAVNQAQNTSADAYLQSLNQNAQAAQMMGNQYNQYLNAMNQYGTAYNNTENALLAPQGMATQYQQAVQPLQSQMANYYAGMPTGFQQMANIGGTALQAASPFLAMIPGVGTGLALGAQVGGQMLSSSGNVFGNPYYRG